MRQTLSKEERQSQLLDAAIKVFGSRGYHQAQISDIIEEAGVARGTFYLYFKSKREIFDAVISRLFEVVNEKVQRLPREAVIEIPSQLKGNLERVTHLLLDRPEWLQLLFNETIGMDESLNERWRQFYNRLLDLIRKGLKQGQEMGFVREGNIQVLAISLLGCVKEVFYQYSLGTEKPNRETIVNELFQTVVHAIASPNLPKELAQLLHLN